MSPCGVLSLLDTVMVVSQIVSCNAVFAVLTGYMCIYIHTHMYIQLCINTYNIEHIKYDIHNT